MKPVGKVVQEKPLQVHEWNFTKTDHSILATEQ